ncbi:AbrB/MazE/SpoVT family DNA-binding domain-containing protein [Pelomicrobium sp. G1]|uniref:AbrB/MazE/SpoVT family DNA-binding domain-containing protein n=1 Tax=unclassified Pelomicrobium TaxID=2815318 RepID=UPI003F767915
MTASLEQAVVDAVRFLPVLSLTKTATEVNVRITSKGQVTIPQAIREKAGLLPATEVEFEYVRGKVILKPAGKRKSRGQSAVERLRGSATNRAWKGKTTDQIMAFLRGDE